MFKGKTGNTFNSQLVSGTDDACSEVICSALLPKPSWEPALGSVSHEAVCADLGADDVRCKIVLLADVLPGISGRDSARE